MRRSCLLLASAFVMCVAGAARAQPPAALSPLETAVACAPPPSFAEAPGHALQIIGSQGTDARSLFGSRDLLVIGGGTSSGVELGQQFFVRRAVHFGTARSGQSVRTLGWVRVVAVNESTAITAVDHICGAMESSDYLEPFVAPVLPLDIDRNDTTGQPDFSMLGRVIAANEDRTSAGAGDFVLIDGAKIPELTAGVRFAIYRDVGVNGLPLASIGEGVVISLGQEMALTRITRSRDAVFTGDYIAVRR